MTDQEGVIQFQLEHTSGPSLPLDQLCELMAWRKILRQLELLGEDPLRYGGFGFGNISRRLPPIANDSACPFVITGTQTGSCSEIGPEHFTTVVECFPEQNRVASVGPIRPSSEAMTHAALYAADPELRVVMHVHSPHIWRSASQLRLPTTRVTAACGTAAMTSAVREMMPQALGLLVMGGHEDGVLTFGQTADQAGVTLLSALARAYQIV